MIRSRLVQVALALGTVTVLIFTIRGLQTPPKKVPPPTVTVTRGVVLATVSATGNVTAENQLALDFDTGGKLVEVLVEEGDKVRRGQALARIDSGPARDQLAAAQGDQEAAQARLAELREGLTPAELAEARSKIDEGQRGVEKANTELSSSEDSRDQDEVAAQAKVDQTRKALATVRAVADKRAADLQADVDQATRRLAHDEDQLALEEARLADDAARYHDLLRLEDGLRVQLDQLRERDRRLEQKQRDKGCAAAGGSSASTTTSTTTPTGTTPVTSRPVKTAAPKGPSSTTATTAPPKPSPTTTSSTTTTRPTTPTTTRPTTPSTTSSSTTTTTAPKNTKADDEKTEECNDIANERSKVQNDIVRTQENLRNVTSDRARAEADVRNDERKIDDVLRQIVIDKEDLSDARNALSTARVEDRKKIEEATDELENALDSLDSTRLEGDQAVSSARDEVASARAALGTRQAEKEVGDQPPTAAQMAIEEGAIDAARARVEEAERTLGETTLYAPADGTIGVINAKVGEEVTGARDTLAFSVSQAAGGTAATEPPGTVSGGSGGFITLTDVSTLQVEARFAEADATRIRPGQVATITFDALGAREVSGNVVSLDSLETVENNVVTYNVTLLLARSEEGIKPGMTASVDVVVAERKGVLRLPTSAVSPREGVATLTVMLPDGETKTRTVRTGLKGDDDIEIVDGLREGDRVVLSPGPAGGPGAPPAGGGSQR
jgi:multidrug efflux pump subunit AcrA (membrane-fusion protein)